MNVNKLVYQRNSEARIAKIAIKINPSNKSYQEISLLSNIVDDNMVPPKIYI